MTRNYLLPTEIMLCMEILRELANVIFCQIGFLYIQKMMKEPCKF